LVEPDEDMQEREAEKLADLESLADALAAFRGLGRDLDQWERVHLARGLAAVFSGCYGAGAAEAAIALTPADERSPSARVPTDPSYARLDLSSLERALNDLWGAPARRFPHFGPVEESCPIGSCRRPPVRARRADSGPVSHEATRCAAMRATMVAMPVERCLSMPGDPRSVD
jgi:hypothetical protein